MSNSSNDNPYERNDVRVGDHAVTSPHDLPDGVTIHFHERSHGNVVRLSETGRYRGLNIDLGSAIDCVVEVGTIRVHFGGLRISFVLNSGRCSKGASVTVGSDTIFNGSSHVIGPLTPGLGSISDTPVCSRLASPSAAPHGLWDLDTGKLLNPEVGIEIGDHVWLGDGVVVLNKAVVPPGSVVAARSIVNRAFTVPNTLIAGVPAAVRRERVAWTNEFPVDNGESPQEVGQLSR